MRSILVDARPGRSGRTRIESALALAREFNGHVRFLVDTPIDRFITIDGMGGSIVSAEALRDALAQDDAFADEIAARITREDVCCDIVRSDDEPVEALAAAAVLADVVVVSRADPVAGDLPLATRVPVLAVNDDRPLAFPLGRVAVGWDGSATAGRRRRGRDPDGRSRRGRVSRDRRCGVPVTPWHRRRTAATAAGRHGRGDPRARTGRPARRSAGDGRLWAQPLA